MQVDSAVQCHGQPPRALVSLATVAQPAMVAGRLALEEYQVLFHAFSFATVVRSPFSVNSICELITHGPATKNRIRRRALPRHGTWKRAGRYLSGRRGSSGIRR